MPVNKHADLRYMVLDRCFSDFSRKYTIEDLLNEINEVFSDLYGSTIGKRQLRSDIQHMRERLAYKAPIKAYPLNGKQCYYRYDDSNFSIYKKDLSCDELKSLRTTINILGRYRGLPDNSWLEEVISKLEYRFGVKPNSENLISFEQNTQLRGLEFLSDVIDFTINHNPVNVHYKTYSGKESVSVFHPYFVKQYNNRWFVFGLDEKKGIIVNKALDRIRRIYKADVQFIPNTTIDFSRFFDDIVGVSVPYENQNIKKETIVLKFEVNRFPYVVSKPIHVSQKVIDKIKSVISIEVKPTRELDQAILAFGPDVEVISPQSYREHIKEKISNNLSKYTSV